MTARRAVLYGIFAAVATLTNFAFQAATVRLWPLPYAVAAGVVIGTLAGLAVKYVLDKRYIFRFTTQSLGQDGRLFVLYGLMSIVTTVIFWSGEFGFGAVFGTESARYIGGALGLLVGYVAKYQLDRRFVFRSSEAVAA
ncbi:GtrA family protein [uncultured Amnibacterium sp.]|uniref:GtrA family protein n=1 Tax=uncultured Amnibacterium sp. TaxID=1631851 RepID=UPI0035CC6989